MPVTPLHFGPAFLLKRAAGRWFSLIAFTASQFLFDVEPGLKLFGLIPEGAGLHVGHTWQIGAVVAAISVGVGLMFARSNPHQLWAAVSGAIFGIVTHLLLDAIYHSDVATSALLPSMFGLISRGALDSALLLMAFIGALLLYKKPV